MKKYELTNETKDHYGITLHRIRALTSFGNVKDGDLGGWVEKEANLDHVGDAWVYGDARVLGNASVSNQKEWLIVGPIGSRSDFTTFYACVDGKIGVTCGCFHGDIEEFEAAVKKRHGDNKHAKMYLLAIEMAKQHIVLTEVEA